jgi:hypothetical protein
MLGLPIGGRFILPSGITLVAATGNGTSTTLIMEQYIWLGFGIE